MILCSKCFLSHCSTSPQEGHCVALAKIADWCLHVNTVLCITDGQLKVSGFLKRVFDLEPEEAWEAVGLATSSVRAWKKKLGSQDFQVWVACKRFPERIQMASVKGTGHRGSVNRKLHSCTVTWVDWCIKESKKNHVCVWEKECYTVLWFVLWCQLKLGFVLPGMLSSLQRGSGVSY